MESPKRDKQQHVHMNRRAWDAAHPGWFAANTDPNWHQNFRDGAVELDCAELELLGDVEGVEVLQLSCAGDASQAFSLANLGAKVTACDFSPAAIEIATENARRIGRDVRFVVDDSQQLSTLEDGAFDLVFADYNLWYYEDLPTACRNWYRVLREGGRLVLHEHHPITVWCVEEDGTEDRLRVLRSYDDRTPEYYRCGDDVGPFSHGDPELEAVEFPHTMADIVTAIAQAGFVIKKMVERMGEEGEDPPKRKLPYDFFVLARRAA
jgi:SAM-dependent methyltransferase